MLLALVRWPISNPTVQKWVSSRDHLLALRLQWFQRKLLDFQKPIFGESQARQQNAQNEEGRANTNIFGHILRSLLLGLFIEFSGPPTCKTHSHRSSGHVRPRRTSVNPILVSTEGVGGSVIVRIFCWKMPHFQQGAPGQRCIFERPAALTAALPIPTKHCKNRDFPPSYAAHPIFERMTGSILERIGRKKAPHYRTQQHIYIYGGGLEMCPGFSCLDLVRCEPRCTWCWFPVYTIKESLLTIILDLHC